MTSNFRIGTPVPQISQGQGFSFQVRYGKLNWRQIIEMDIDRLIQTGDIDLLKHILENLTYAVLDRDDLSRVQDSNVVKLFKISQLAVEYLLYVQSGLSKQSEEFSQRYQLASNQRQELSEQVLANEKEIEKLKEEYIQKKKSVNTYQLLLQQPATSTLLNKAMVRSNAVKCPQCPKAYMSQYFLEQHIMRRHSNRPVSAPVQKSETQGTELFAVMDTMKLLMTQQLEVTREMHTRELESLRFQFEKQVQEISHQTKVMELQRTQTIEALKNMPREEGKGLFELQLLQKEREELARAVEEYSQQMEEQEKRIESVRMNYQKLYKQKAQLETKVQFNTLEIEEYDEVPSNVPEPRQIESPKPASPPQESVKTPPRGPSPEPERVSTPPPSAKSVRFQLEEEEEIVPRPTAPKHQEPLASNAGELEDDVPSEGFPAYSNAGDIESDEGSVERIPTREIFIQEEDIEDNTYINNPPTYDSQAQEISSQISESLEASYNDITTTLQELDIDPKEKLYHYIAEMYRKKPLLDEWEEVQQVQEIVYRNVNTNEIMEDHPGKGYYKQLYQQVKAKHSQILAQVEEYLEGNAKSTVLDEKYGDNGIPVLRQYEPEEINKVRNKHIIEIAKNMHQFVPNPKTDPKIQSSYQKIQDELQHYYLLRSGQRVAAAEVKPPQASVRVEAVQEQPQLQFESKKLQLFQLEQKPTEIEEEKKNSPRSVRQEQEGDYS